ncbi:hypothetical protein [Tropicimonas sp.]|uniref:hypothetical protein n=1 Tax=Tropicimonas sp. TaxID=2067044 RepID=UPI003A86F92E
MVALDYEISEPVIDGKHVYATTDLSHRLFTALKPDTLRQRGVTNCPIPALIAAMAHAQPEMLRAMVTVRQLATPVRAWWYQTPINPPNTAFPVDKVVRVRFQHRSVEVTPRLYLGDDYSARYCHTTASEGYAPYIEKAYVAYRCRFDYQNLNFWAGYSATPLSVERIMEDFVADYDCIRFKHRVHPQTGRVVAADFTVFRDPELASFDAPPGEEDQEQFDGWSTGKRVGGRKAQLNKLHGFFKQSHRRATVVTTANHTLAVIGYAPLVKKVTLFDAMSHHVPHEETIGLGEFLRRHDGVYQARIGRSKRSWRPPD